MMWSFAIGAFVHALLIATPKALVLDGAMLLLALAGSVAQDWKKRKLEGSTWLAWRDQTAFWPFGKGFANPGLIATAGGTLLFLVATWLHHFS
jgi:uncharacterized membrane protein